VIADGAAQILIGSDEMQTDIDAILVDTSTTLPAEHVQIQSAADTALGGSHTYYVDSANGSDAYDGTTWAKATATIAAGLLLMADTDTLMVGGVAYQEDVVTPVGIERGKIIGVCNNNQISYWQSTAAGTSHLTMSSGEWEVANFRFAGTTNTAAYIVITWDGSSAIVRDCWLSGDGAESGIETTGAATDVKVLRNRFSGFTTTDARDGAICGTDYGTQAAGVWEIKDNWFGDNTKNINLLALSCRIEGNTFTTSTSGTATTVIISTRAAEPTGAGGGNVVAGNYFPHQSYQVDQAHGYYSSTDDTWVGNYCTDGLSSENFPGLGTALIEFNNVVPKTYLCSEVTSVMTTTDYGTGDSPVDIFTVTGDILCRAHAICETTCTSASATGTLELGVAGNTALLLVQDVVSATEFLAGDIWTLNGGAEDDILLALPTQWYYIGGGADIILTIGSNDMASGQIRFNLEWVPMSPDAEVVGAAP